MKLLFKQRIFSWLDSFDVYDETGEIYYKVEGKLALGHCLEISDKYGLLIGIVKQELFSFLPRFVLYDASSNIIGEIKKEFTFFKPVFTLKYSDWNITGDIFGWDYTVEGKNATTIMSASKQLLNWSDTYIIDIADDQNILISLMIVLAIDAAKCSQSS